MATKKETRGNRQENEITIEGGDIKELDDAPYKIDDLKKQRAATTRTLAYLLVACLILSVVTHYGMVAWLLSTGKKDVVIELSTIFGIWLPVISGLAGSAVTYYFTQEK
jgi:H+/Cl- antiporter ClcA